MPIGISQKVTPLRARVRTSCNETVDQRLFPFEEILVQDFSPVVPVQYKLVLKKVNERSLIPG